MIVLLTSPLQSAGEEYAARGLLARSFGSFTTQRTVSLLLAMLAPNLMFTVIHGLADPWLVAYTFSVGLACAVITWRTGGIQGAVVLLTQRTTPSCSWSPPSSPARSPSIATPGRAR